MGKGQRIFRRMVAQKNEEERAQALVDFLETRHQKQEAERRAEFVLENPLSDADRWAHFDLGRCPARLLVSWS